MKSLKSTYRKWQKDHPNFITPELIKIEQASDKIIIELSEGTDFNHKPMYGVTIAEYKGSGKFSTFEHSDESKPFYSRIEAEKYFKKKVSI